MKSVVSAMCALAMFCIVLPQAFAGSRKCSNPAGECEREIRAMLAEKPGPLGFSVRSVAGGRGIVVKSVTPDGPAARAGLQPGDRVMSLDNYDLSKATSSDLYRIREKVMSDPRKEPGTGKLVITVNRVGTFKRLTLRIQKMSKEQIDQVVAAHLREAHGTDAAAQKSDGSVQQ